MFLPVSSMMLFHPLTTWTPTVGGVTKGNGTETARYARLGPLVTCFYRFVFGSGSSLSGDVSITHPVAAIAPLWVARSSCTPG